MFKLSIERIFAQIFRLKNVFHIGAMFASLLWSQLVFGQCAIDVVINEAPTIEMCEDAPQSITASNGFVSYGWTGPETLTGQTITPQFSGQYVVAAVDGVGCVSTDTIDVTINPSPTPAIVSSEGNPICPSSTGTTLSTTLSYTSYDWGAGNTGPTFFAPGTGAYSLTVTDNNGCKGHEVITITAYNFNVSATTVDGCYGETTALIATGGPGATYLWSTSETSNTIVVSPIVTTTYTVSITNGSCTESLPISVSPVVYEPYELPDTIYSAAGETHTLEGPSGNFTFNWTPSDQIDFPTLGVVTLTANTSQTIYMTATHSSGCVIEDSVVVIVIDLAIPDGISPNGDGINETFFIPGLEGLDASLLIWNRWGDIVLNTDHYENNWDGTCKTSLCMGNGVLPEGTYFYSLNVQDVKVTGYITLKL